MSLATPPARPRRAHDLGLALRALQAWDARRILVAAVATIAVGVLIGVVTVLIPNDIFGRDIPPVWWNYRVWLLTSVLAGMLIATYVRVSRTPAEELS